MIATPATSLVRLFAAPWRFTFDAAVRLLLLQSGTADPNAVIRFRSPASQAFAASDVLSVEKGGNHEIMTVAPIGLAGPAGVLPRPYLEAIRHTTQQRSPALHQFIDMLAQRMIAGFALAGFKYRMDRQEETVRFGATRGAGMHRTILLATTGFALGNDAQRLATGPDPILHYAGLFAAGPRSAERLRALVTDWLGHAVEVVEFVGAWLRISCDEQTRLPHGRSERGAFCRLGYDASPGARAWDPQAGILLRVGPLDGASFAALLPGRPALTRLIDLVRAYLGLDVGFAVNLVLRAIEVPSLQLAREPGPEQVGGRRLGLDAWLNRPTHSPSAHDLADACFSPAIVQRLSGANAESPSTAEPAIDCESASPGNLSSAPGSLARPQVIRRYESGTPTPIGVP